MFQIPGFRQGYYQWDLNQRILVTEENCNEVHFFNAKCKEPLTCEVKHEGTVRYALVPNILLQENLPITVYAYVMGWDESYTRMSVQLSVKARPKPADYVYEETEIKTWESAVELALKTARESGDFKGDKGDKGDTGAQGPKGEKGDKGDKGDPGVEIDVFLTRKGCAADAAATGKRLAIVEQDINTLEDAVFVTTIEERDIAEWKAGYVVQSGTGIKIHTEGFAVSIHGDATGLKEGQTLKLSWAEANGYNIFWMSDDTFVEKTYLVDQGETKQNVYDLEVTVPAGVNRMILNTYTYAGVKKVIGEVQVKTSKLVGHAERIGELEENAADTDERLAAVSQDVQVLDSAVFTPVIEERDIAEWKPGYVVQSGTGIKVHTEGFAVNIHGDATGLKEGQTLKLNFKEVNGYNIFWMSDDTFVEKTYLVDQNTQGSRTVYDYEVIVPSGCNRLIVNSYNYALINGIVKIGEVAVPAASKNAIDVTKYGLPVLALTGGIFAMTKETPVTMGYEFQGRSGTCEVKPQGSSSMAYPKKNFTIKFDTAFEAVEGWGVQKKYCAKANYIDFSHARNVVSGKLWGKIVKSRANIVSGLENLPNGGAIDGFAIIITINGEFYGLYTFNIPKDGWMFGMSDSSLQQAILCASGAGGDVGNLFKAEALLDGSDFELEYVSDEDNADWVLPSLNRLINAVINSDGTDLDTTVAQYLDWESAIDYCIFVILTNGIDMISKNYLLATYDGVKWFFSAYDMDSTYSLWWDGTKFIEPYTRDVTIEHFSGRHRIMELLTKYKSEELHERYKQLRETVMSEDQVALAFTNFGVGIPSTVFAEDAKKWPTIPSTSVNNTDQILSFYRIQMQKADKEFGYTTEEVKSNTQRIENLEAEVKIHTNEINCWGDSLTDGSGSTGGGGYPVILQNLLGSDYKVNNYGLAGEGVRKIATRRGAVPMYAEPFTIPASGSVTGVVVKDWGGTQVKNMFVRGGVMNESWYNFSKFAINPVIIGGVEGNLKQITGTTDSYTFERLTSGEEVVLTRPTMVNTYGNRLPANHVDILWLGTNDSVNAGQSGFISDYIRYMIDRGETDGRYIVIGLQSKKYCPDIVNDNKKIAANFGRHFLDIRKYMLEYGLADAGLKPTEQDTADIADGYIPASLYKDAGVHFNDYGYRIVAEQVYKKGQELGYW